MADSERRGIPDIEQWQLRAETSHSKFGLSQNYHHHESLSLLVIIDQSSYHGLYSRQIDLQMQHSILSIGRSYFLLERSELTLQAQ